MAQTDWVFSIESKIYTIIKTRLEKALKTTYPNLLVTQQQKMNDNTSIPTVFIKMLDSPEIGQDLDNATINAMLVYFETHITVTKDMGLTGLRKISESVLGNFKALRFNIGYRGTVRETSDTYTLVSRFNRVIGANEEINL